MRLGGLRDGAQKDGDRQMKKRKKGEEPRPLTIKASFEGADSSSPIGKLTRATVAEWNEQKHRRPSREEMELIDSLFDGCPYATEGDGAAHECIKYGFTGLGVQRYLCKRCGRQFTPLTGTKIEFRSVTRSSDFTNRMKVRVPVGQIGVSLSLRLGAMGVRTQSVNRSIENNDVETASPQSQSTVGGMTGGMGM